MPSTRTSRVTRIEPLESRIALATLMVTTVVDSGPGSLRQAILDANAIGGFDTILFDLPEGTHIFSPASALPLITGPTTLSGDNAVLPSAAPRFVLSGTLAGSADGLRFGAGSAGSQVSGLTITGFSGDGIEIINSSSIVIAKCLLGAITGTGNTGAGIRLTDSSFVTIGGKLSPENLTQPNTTAWGESNVITGNAGGGILMSGGSGHGIYGNLIGITPGNVTKANAIGIRATNSSVTIGSADPGAGNIVSGNTGLGIEISGAGSVVVKGNRIGTDIAGLVAKSNSASGIYVGSAKSITIGGVLPGEGNLISGNNNGISLTGRTGVAGVPVIIQGNFIGTDATGTQAIPNRRDGIRVDQWDDVIIGGTTPESKNLLSGNLRSGIYLIYSTNSVVQGNYIGTDISGSKSLGNLRDGINLVGAVGVKIGGPASGAGNLISGNTGHGISVDTTGNEDDGTKIRSSANVSLQGNLIGTDHTGSRALGNSASGVILGGSLVSVSGNVIAANLGAGITVTGSGHTIAANHIGVDADGTSPLGNRGAGILFQTAVYPTPATSTVTVHKNVISGNGPLQPTSGIHIHGTKHVITENLIGLDASGTFAISNSGSGVTGSGSVVVSKNIISGNLLKGLDLLAATLEFNRIGTDQTGTIAIPNQGGGARLIGPGVLKENIISGNHGLGLELLTSAKLTGNYIGTDPTGTIAIPNSGGGVRISGSAVLNQNIISGNTGIGLELLSNGTLTGNIIGTDGTGTLALGNTGAGIRIATSLLVAIGMGTSADGNIIAANGGSGIEATVSPNLVVLNNRIGIGSGGEDLGNGADGLRLSGNNLKLTARENMIGANAGHGIALALGATAGAVAIESNLIGLGGIGQAYAARGNGLDGIHVQGAGRLSTPQLSISHNQLASNGSAAIYLGNLDFDHDDPATAQLTRASAVIAGNTIGGVIDLTNAALQSPGPGIVLENTLFVRVGLAESANVIGGQAGIDPFRNAAIKIIGGRNNNIGGNTLGAIAGLPAGPTGHIYLDGGMDHVIGFDPRLDSIGHAGGGPNDLTGSGIHMSGERFYVSGNKLTDSTWGIVTVGGSYHQIVNNVVVNSSRWGIAFDGGAEFATISGNIIKRASDGGINGLRSGSVARQNFIEDVGGPGISGGFGEDLEIIGNVIAGTAGAGIHLAGAPNSTVTHNIISGFVGAGIRYTAGNATSHGFALENTIRHGDGVGIEIVDGSIELQRNTIYGNTGIPIDLGADGLTANDAGDVDSGPNGLQNGMVFRPVVHRAGELIIRGSFDGIPSRQLRIEFFSVTIGSDGGQADSHFLAETYVETDANGHSMLALSLPLISPAGQIFATVTDVTDHVTSEAAFAKVARGFDVIAIGTGAGARGTAALVQARVPFESVLSVTPYGAAYRGGVHVAHWDMDGDRLDDLITAPAANGRTIRIFSGLDGSLMTEWIAAPRGFRGGISVVVGDVDGDGSPEIVTALGRGSAPVVKIHDALTGALETQFTAFASKRRSGLNLSMGDLDADGDADIVASWARGPALARAFTGSGEPLTPVIRPFASKVSLGTFTTVIPATPESSAMIALGSGHGSRAAIEIFDLSGSRVETIAMFKHARVAGLRLAVADVDGDGIANIIATRAAGSSQFEALAGSGRWLGSFFSSSTRSGVYLG